MFYFYLRDTRFVMMVMRSTTALPCTKGDFCILPSLCVWEVIWAEIIAFKTLSDVMSMLSYLMLWWMMIVKESLKNHKNYHFGIYQLKNNVSFLLICITFLLPLHSAGLKLVCLHHQLQSLFIKLFHAAFVTKIFRKQYDSSDGGKRFF